MRWFGRLRRSGEIGFVRRRGRSVALTTVTVYGSEAASGCSRACVTVSKSVGGAVVRNFVRRRIRGALEALPSPSGCRRLVFVAKPAAARASYALVAREIALALARLTLE